MSWVSSNIRTMAAMRSLCVHTPSGSRAFRSLLASLRAFRSSNGCIHCSLNLVMSSGVTRRPAETVMKPGSPATATLTVASVRCSFLLVSTSENVVGRGRGKPRLGTTVNLSLPDRGSCFARGRVGETRVRVGETGQPFGTSTDQVSIVSKEVSSSRSKAAGFAVKRPVMSPMQSGGGGGPPGGIARQGLVQALAPRTIAAARHAETQENVSALPEADPPWNSYVRHRVRSPARPSSSKVATSIRSRPRNATIQARTC